jgi:hypothetical protein
MGGLVQVFHFEIKIYLASAKHHYHAGVFGSGFGGDYKAYDAVSHNG